MANSRLKSNTDVRRKELVFEVDYWVYLKVSPMNVVMTIQRRRRRILVHGILALIEYLRRLVR